MAHRFELNSQVLPGEWMKPAGSLVGYYDATPVSEQLDQVAQACRGKDRWAGAIKHVKTFLSLRSWIRTQLW
eukprot:10660771-Karenia_brevis.AAC.1